MAFGAAAASSSSGNQEYVLCGTDYVKVYKTTTADNSPEIHLLLLIRSLADHYADENQNLDLACRRDSFVECPNNVNGMRNAAKYADAVILLINAYVGFEMETFEFLNRLLQHSLRLQGMPKVMGVLTSLDRFGNNFSKRIRTETCLIQYFRIEVCKGAKLFSLSGLDHGMYNKSEILDLASFISAMDFHPLSWQAAPPYLLAEHFEDVTRTERVHMDIRCNRDIVLHGYLRGCDIKKGGAKVHIAGVGDFPLFSVTSLADPCPLLAGPKKKRSRKGKEGFRSGTYLRLEVRDVPFEILENYDPYHPILVGGISPGEEYVGYMQAKDTTVIDLTVKEEEPPYVIVVHGPPKVGKSLLIRSRKILIMHYTWKCPNSVNGMLDAAKYADAVILLIDTSIEPKNYIMNRFCTEIYEGATLFCLSGLEHGKYLKHEILDLVSFISVMEFHPLSWRAAQPYVLVDRYEDATLPERVVMDNRCNRDIVLYGYLRGCDIKKGTKVSIAGMGDFPLSGVTSYVDPCLTLKKRRSQKGKEEDEYPGFRPGTYLRLEVRDVHFEMIENIDRNHPILVGGISPGEEKHRKLLKTRDPIIVSIGWRRYQTIPVYATEDSSKWPRMLYTTVDTQCLAMFWGPLASLDTGIAAFRILATAVVVDYDIAKILKKCKRSRTPWKISGKTALIEDLFKSDDEFYRFKDAKLWTES
ncbi:hypothetical protein MKX03_004738 [Papaver bracteatum]|nr:hypothetical protein MKX03_004738 [Papaver bracteatum]